MSLTSRALENIQINFIITLKNQIDKTVKVNIILVGNVSRAKFVVTLVAHSYQAESDGFDP